MHVLPKLTRLLGMRCIVAFRSLASKVFFSEGTSCGVAGSDGVATPPPLTHSLESRSSWANVIVQRGNPLLMVAEATFQARLRLPIVAHQAVSATEA